MNKEIIRKAFKRMEEHCLVINQPILFRGCPDDSEDRRASSLSDNEVEILQPHTILKGIHNLENPNGIKHN